MELDYVCKQSFAYFYEKVYLKPCSSLLIDSEKSLKAVKSFVFGLKKKYGTSVGAEYVFIYLLFQFGRYLEKIEKDTFASGTKITPVMVFGHTAFDVYQKRNQKMDFITERNPLVIKYKIQKKELEFRKGIEFGVKVSQSERELYKDPIKAIASKGENPLGTCEDMTDLFNDNDPSCTNCIDKEKCKTRLKEWYPHIYKERNYE